MSFDGLFAYNAGNILPSTLKWYIASVLEIVSLWHKLFISPPPLPTSLLYSRWLCTMPTVSWNTVFLEHVLYFVCQPVGTMSWPWASLIFLDYRCNFLLRWLFTVLFWFWKFNLNFLGRDPRSLFRSGSKWVFFWYCSTSSFVWFK